MFGDTGFDWMTFGLGVLCGVLLMLVVRRRQSRAGPRDLAAPPLPPPVLPADVHAQVLLLRAQGRTIEAIKLVRDRTRCDLKTAKDVVDRLR